MIGLDHWIALALMPCVSAVVCIALFRFYRAPESARSALWLGRGRLVPGDLRGPHHWQLLLVSVVGLFLELLIIRWLSSEVQVLAYFKNFVLIACFLGFGLGCYLCRRPVSLPALLAPLIVLVLLVKAPSRALHQLLTSLPSMIGRLSEVDTRGLPSLHLDASSVAGLLTGVIVIVPLLALTALVFIPLGQLVGWYLEHARNGIRSYSVNILGSLAGILLYTLLCLLYQPPAVWFAVAGVLLLALLWGLPWLQALVAVGVAVAGVLTSSHPFVPGTVLWSPYQKLTLTPQREGTELVAYELTTNDSYYQHIFNLSPEFVTRHPELFRNAPVEWNAYNIPYRFYAHPASVLVLGAGTGNDVAAALRNGAGRVVAVEIDPLILELGRRLHFERPYASPRVQQVVDDARSYIQNSTDRFDLIVFSLLDSHTTASYYSNIRLDNYVYTVEALRAAKHLLRPDGLLIIKFWVETPWIAGRLGELVEASCGRAPPQFQAVATGYTTPGRFLVCGDAQRVTAALADPALGAYVRDHLVPDIETATLTTDDWPYFYQHEPGLPLSVIVTSAVLVLLCLAVLRRARADGAGRTINWHFFFLGAGFLLLEAGTVSRMALLFGTTWMVNSVVIAGLLLLIFAANLLVERVPRVPVSLGYAGIFATIVVAYAVPLEWLFVPSPWLKGLAATLVLCLPVFFAGIVFIRTFANEGFVGTALGSNLLGALAGGLLESLSLWTGIRALLIVAFVLYLASWAALVLRRAHEPARTAPRLQEGPA